MRGYVLTERGKLLVAMLIVLLLIVPSVLIVVWLSSRDNTPNDDEANNPDSSQDSSASDNRNMVSFDLSAGLMTFLFSPGSQSSIDDYTAVRIGDLLKSPHNTDTSIIAVEMPLLSDDEAAILTNAIIDAFGKNNISMSDVVFYVYHPETSSSSYEVNISFR